MYIQTKQKERNMQAIETQNPTTFDTVKIQMIHAEATSAAKAAVARFLDTWKANTGGNQYGEPMYCGFAWVDVKVRSNSKLGKALQSVGFKKSWQSGYLQLW